MYIIKKKKYRRLKACKRACNLIYDILMDSGEDEHGNVKAYRHDRVYADILEVLKNVGIGERPDGGGWVPPFEVVKR